MPFIKHMLPSTCLFIAVMLLILIPEQIVLIVIFFSLSLFFKLYTLIKWYKQRE